jgi:hypothetical protein
MVSNQSTCLSLERSDSRGKHILVYQVTTLLTKSVEYEQLKEAAAFTVSSFKSCLFVVGRGGAFLAWWLRRQEYVIGGIQGED